MERQGDLPLSGHKRGRSNVLRPTIPSRHEGGFALMSSSQQPIEDSWDDVVPPNQPSPATDPNTRIKNPIIRAWVDTSHAALPYIVGSMITFAVLAATAGMTGPPPPLNSGSTVVVPDVDQRPAKLKPGNAATPPRQP